MPPARREDPLPTPEAREAFIELLQQEEWLKKILDKLDRPRFQLDKSLIGEMQEMASEHAGYRLPIVRDRQDMVALQESNALCLAHRDRITEILISYVSIKHALDTLWDAAEERLQGYAAYKALGNERARTLFVQSVLAPINEKRRYANNVVAVAEELRDSLTHAHFSIQQQSKMGETVLGQKSS